MHNRIEEFNKLKQEYQSMNMPKGQVDEMKKMIAKAKKENRHAVWKTVAATAAAAAVILTVLPNTSGAVAHAMSRIPILSKWVEVVTFRDYQYESERNMADVQVPEVVPQIPTEEADSQTKEAIENSAVEINEEIQAIADTFIQEFEENKKNEEGYQDIIVDSEIIATTQNYFTLKLICYQGAGSGAEWHYFYTIDLKTGQRLQLKDLFTEGSGYVDAINESILSQMKEQMAADENVIYWVDCDIPDLNFKTITDETQFYINEKGELVISFSEGDVAPMYMGCVEFTIPNDALSGMRTDGF